MNALPQHNTTHHITRYILFILSNCWILWRRLTYSSSTTLLSSSSISPTIISKWNETKCKSMWLDKMCGLSPVDGSRVVNNRKKCYKRHYRIIITTFTFITSPFIAFTVTSAELLPRDKYLSCFHHFPLLSTSWSDVCPSPKLVD